MAIALGPYELRVQVAFDAGPFNASPTWTDVTDDVLAPEGVSFSRGARSVGGKPGPGLANLRMRNWAEGSKVAGRWTPGVAAGPWHPLKHKRRIRIQARYSGGAWQGLWGGHLTDHVPRWVGAAKPVCDLSASDLLAALSRLKAMPDIMVGEQLYESPTHAWPLDDAEGSTTAGDRTPARGPLLTRVAAGSPVDAVIDFGAVTTPTERPGATFTPDSLTAGYAMSAPTAIAATNGLVVEAAVRPGGTTTGVRPIVLLLDEGSGAWVAVSWEQGYGISIRQGTRLTGWTGAPTVYDAATVDEWTTVGVRLYAGGATLDLAAVDGPGAGAIIGGGTIGGPGSAFRATKVYVGGVPANIVGASAATFEGTIANVAVYSTDWPNAAFARLTAHMAALGSSVVDARFAALCRIAGLPAGLYSASASSRPMGVQPTDGKRLTSALGEVADADQGKVSVDRDGLLRFYALADRRGAASVVTLDATKDVLNDFDGLPFNDEGLLNDVTVARIGGATQRAVNQASADEYGTISDSLEVYLADDDQARRLAEWLANKDAEPQLRAPTIKVSMAALAARSPSKVAAVMALELGQRITLSNLPAGLPATTLDLFVEGVSDEYGKNDWVRTITTSSLWRNGAVWILGDSFYGVLGSTTILGY